MSTLRKKNVLICPLDWGLGHATRCVPIINKFKEKGANVFIAASNRPLAFLKKEFPDLNFIDFPGYNITYPKGGSMAFAMLKSSPAILKAIQKEKIQIEQIIEKNSIEIVISDNRFGLASSNAYSIYMTHQILIRCPSPLRFLESSLFRKHKSYISQYNECWIPDFDGEMNLSGDLSHKYTAHPQTFFIGPLSRFSEIKQDEITRNFLYDIMVILSGPEPQRSIIEDIIHEQALKMKNLKFLIVRGITEKDTENHEDNNIRLVSHLETAAMRQAIIESDLIVCRPGYSSIMDLSVLGKKAAFVPTPGQTEQEYLAAYFFSRKYYFFMSQQGFDLKECIEKAKLFSPPELKSIPKTLDDRIDYLLEK